MTLDPSTPVLVGAGSVCMRDADPTAVPEAAVLMAEATEAALEQTGPALRQRLGLVAAMASTTPYRDPARLVAEAVGLRGARTVVAEPGVLQQQVISRACRAVADGAIEAALLVGGEAKYRAQQAAFGGVEVADTVQGEAVEPGERLTADDLVIHRCEIEAGLIQAVHHYAMIDAAFGNTRNLTPAENSAQVAELWAHFSRIAADNPDAWSRRAVEAREIATPGPANRMLATPYAKLHNSQWNVNQAASLVVTSVGVAESAGVPRDSWVFPLGAVESNHMVPLVERAEPGRCPGFAVVGEELGELTGVPVQSADHFELYSCFPVAVRLQVTEMGLEPRRDLSVTGGMTFAGGPFNHFVFQSLVKLIEVLRDDPGSTGLITSVSGMVTKQAAGLWSTSPPSGLARFVDASARVRAVTPVRPAQPGYAGPAQVVTSTVVWDREGPTRAVAVVETPGGGRLVATSEASDVLAAFGDGPRIGEQVEVDAVAADSAVSLVRR